MSALVGSRARRLLQLTILLWLVGTLAPVGTSAGARQAASDTSELLARIQAAVVAGSASDFMALDASTPGVRAFLDRWFVTGTTAAELRERDRVPAKDGSGVALVVEALIQAGAQARLATLQGREKKQPAVKPAPKEGLASLYPGDKGIERDPRVIFVENFEHRRGLEIGDWD